MSAMYDFVVAVVFKADLSIVLQIQNFLMQVLKTLQES